MIAQKNQFQTWEKIIAWTLTIGIVGLIIFLAIRNEPFQDPNMVIFLRLLLAVALGFWGGLLLGKMEIEGKVKSIFVRASGGLAIFVLSLVLTPKVISKLSFKNDESSQPKSTTFSIRFAEYPKETPPDSDKFGLAQRFYLKLSNSHFGLATVDDVSVEVLGMLPNETGLTQAKIEPYKYDLTLNPQEKGVFSFAQNFKYSPGETDTLDLGLFTKEHGYDYIFRVVVKWVDEVTHEKHSTATEIAVASFPNRIPNPMVTLEEAAYLQGEQAKRRNKKIEEIKTTLSQKKS